MALPQYQKANFKTLKRAFADGNVALMECTDSHGNTIPVVCAVQRDGDDYIFVPLAKLFTSNPYDELNPPN